VLFNFLCSDCLTPGDIQESYADNFNALESDSDMTLLDRRLQAAVDTIVDWATRKKLMIAPHESQVTLFTSWNKQLITRPDISIAGIPVPLVFHPKILGITFDSLLTFRYHLIDILLKMSQWLNILRAVSGSTWGHNRETLLTYRALVESVINYSCAIWFPVCKPSNVQKLQFVQNAAMGLITGCHKAASEDHLHAETELMPVADHLAMLCTQFLASYMRTAHPLHEVVKLPPGPRCNAKDRPMKENSVLQIW
jgi:hypothetical protein